MGDALPIEMQRVDRDWRDHVASARATIEAMRESTALMVTAGLVQSNVDDINLTENEVEGIFRAMLDAALQEGKEAP